MTDAGGGGEIATDGAVDIGAAIQRGVELLAQQSVETPTFQLRDGASGGRALARYSRRRALWAFSHCHVPGKQMHLEIRAESPLA